MFRNKIYILPMIALTLAFCCCDTSDDSIPAVLKSVPSGVQIVYSGDTAYVTIPDTISDVKATVKGANVILTSTATSKEITYSASGISTSGSLVINGNYKLTLQLMGLTLTNPKGAAIDVECGKRINVVLASGTTNTLTDSKGGMQKACFYSRGHVEFSGAGTLLLTGNTKHAFSCKEYLEIKKTTGLIQVLSAVGDGLHCGEYFQMNGGTVTIAQTGGDCIDSDDLGNMLIKGGTLALDVDGEDTKGLKCDSTMTITGGTFTINAKANGAKGISVGQNMTIGTEVALADGTVPSIIIAATGGVFSNSDGSSKCMGIKVDKNLTIYRGNVTVTNTGTSSYGIKVDGTYTAGTDAKVTANVDNSK
jgi:hypothetical protein